MANIAEQSRRRRQMVTADPLTIVALAREGLHEFPDNQRSSETYGALEECISRFDQLSRVLTPAAPDGGQWGTSS